MLNFVCFQTTTTPIKITRAFSFILCLLVDQAVYPVPFQTYRVSSLIHRLSLSLPLFKLHPCEYCARKFEGEREPDMEPRPLVPFPNFNSCPIKKARCGRGSVPGSPSLLQFFSHNILLTNQASLRATECKCPLLPSFCIANPSKTLVFVSVASAMGRVEKGASSYKLPCDYVICNILV